VWDIASASKTEQIGDCSHPVIAISLNASDELLAVAYENGQVQLYDLETGTFITRFYTRGAPVNVEFFRKTDESEIDRLVVADLGTIWMYSIDDEIIMLSDFVSIGYVQSITDMGLRQNTVFDIPDVAVVITVTHPQMWSSLGLARTTYVFKQSEMTYGQALDFDSKGQLFAMAGKFTAAGGGCDAVRCAIEIFYTGEEDQPHQHAFGDRLIVLDGHSVWHTDIRFSPSSRYLASASRDGLVIVWGIPTS
jgi:WD40 repeat protein